MAKEFQRKFMHPTRRKLVDMVMTGGEYDKNTQIGYTSDVIERKVGDIWEDEHHRYEKKEGYTLKTGKNSEAFNDIRNYLHEQTKCKNIECKRVKKSKTDAKLIQKTGYCVDCLAKIETDIKLQDIWQEYQDYKIYTRMIIEGKIKLEQLKQSIDEVKPFYEYINEDGSVEKWELPQSVEETKKEIQEYIDSGEIELKEIQDKRNEAFEVIRSKNYEHYL
jgi:hypothetical protein